jgi:hypothetical protein
MSSEQRLVVIIGFKPKPTGEDSEAYFEIKPIRISSF